MTDPRQKRRRTRVALKGDDVTVRVESMFRYHGELLARGRVLNMPRAEAADMAALRMVSYVTTASPPQESTPTASRYSRRDMRARE
jgi:hypothetical protein